jgi:uncharacterized RDD family membrane protein YckC
VVLAVALFVVADSLGVSGAWIIALMIFLAFFLQWAYFSICELMMDGRTPGKSLVGLRTVSSLGGRPSAGAILVRNLLRLVDMFFGWPLIALDSRNRRLGDLLAATQVVHDRGDEHGVRLGSVPQSWGSREVAVVESFLRRARRMEAGRARRQAGVLLHWMRHREPEFLASHGLEPDELSVTISGPYADPVALLGDLLHAESV